MGRKIFIVLVCFGLSFVYLHQKINIYVEAYKIDKNYKEYNKLVDLKDFLLYNLFQKVSLVELNSWVEKKEFQFAKEDRLVALVLNEYKKEDIDKGANRNFSLTHHFFSSSTISEVLAEEQP